MKPYTQLARLVAEIDRRGALRASVASAPGRCPIDLEFPRVFAELVIKHSFVAFDVGGVRVHSNLQEEEDNFEKLLSDTILTRALCGAGFAPFGRPVTGSYDRVCFDMRATRHPFDAPVVVMDHESILSHNRIPAPRKLAEGFVDLFALGPSGPTP